jgi:hypothetical protein
MSKTPEEMAEEYCDQFSWNDPREEDAHDAFLAGYKAAQEQYCEAVKVLEKHKAAAEKAVTNIKNAGDWVTIQKLESNSLDPITNLPTSAKWISVKDRLPEEFEEILWCHAPTSEMAVGQLVVAPPYFTHWMELPAPPKEDK